MKSSKTANLKRGWIYVVGIVKTSIMLTCVAADGNPDLAVEPPQR